MTQTTPGSLLTSADYAAAARLALPADVTGFIDGGAGEEHTLAANQAAFDRAVLRPRVLTGMAAPEPAVDVLGRRWPVPFGIAPMAYHTLVHPEGELATARAVERTGVPFVVGMLAGQPWPDIRALTAAPLWLQLYALRSEESTAELLRRAADTGFEAVVLTVDTPRLGRRLRDLRSGFRLPPHVRPVNLVDADRTGAADPARHTTEHLADRLTWEAVARLTARSPLPVLVKGVMTGPDARRAIEVGAAGVIVSNHGGRQLDGLPATLDVIEEVVAAVAGDGPVLVDGGVRRGRDVVAALALGATAALIGRPVLHALAAGGEDGVVGLFDVLRSELDDTMALAGRPDVRAIDRTTVAGPPAGHLELAQLHGSLRDPLLDTMTFLNEVTARYPRAISFAPGRPYEDDFDVEEPVRDLAAYVAHLRGEGADEAEIRRTLLQYGPTAGTIREVVARTLAHDGLPVDPDHLVITVGAQEALLITLRALLADDHDVLLVTDPAYVGVTGAARLLDARVHPVAEGPDGPDPHALTTALRDVRERGLRPRALSVVPDFANPSGTSMSVSARRRLLDLLRPEGVLVVEDNPYRLLGPAPHPPTLKALDRHRQVVHIGSFAKTLFPGTRIGYVVADQVVHRPDGTTGTLAHELARLKSMITVNTPPLAQAVVAGALHRRDLRLGPATAGAAQRYASLMTLLRSELTRLFPPADRERLGVSWNDPAGGFFIALTVPFPAGPEALARCAEEFGVLWTPMRYFHADTAGDRVIRLSISCLDRDQVITGAERLAAFVRDEDERS